MMTPPTCTHIFSNYIYLIIEKNRELLKVCTHNRMKNGVYYTIKYLYYRI